MIQVSTVDRRCGGGFACRGCGAPRRCGSPRRGVLPVLVVAGLFLAVDAASGAQPPGSYQHLSAQARAFVDRLAGVGDGDGQADDAAVYNALEESERTTFEAIMHALEAQGLLGLVVSVTAVWGEIPGSREGRDQFRLSVTLTEGAPARFRGSGYPGRGGAHVKLPSGTRVGRRDADTARQSEGPPSMQVSWLKRDPTVGEIDIDYVPFGLLDFVLGTGHLSPHNSDVRADLLGPPANYDVHVRRYGRLERWWVTQ